VQRSPVRGILRCARIVSSPFPQKVEPKECE
jgi:hypothetical protein